MINEASHLEQKQWERYHRDPLTCKLYFVATFNWKTVCKMVQSGLAFIAAVAQR